MERERLPLLPRTSTVEEARVRNLSKRVKLHSKRLRQLWPRIASFLRARDVLSLGSTCRRVQRLLDNDRVWQSHYDRVLSENVTRLLLPHLESRFDDQLPTKEKLRRVIHARRVHDPTNSLQMRLREAEREVFRLELRQHKVRSVVWMNVPLVLTLCCLSVWSYNTINAEDDYTSGIPSPQLRGAASGSSQPAPVNPVKSFVLVTDLLLLVAIMILSVGDLAGKALYTVGVLTAIEAAVMLAEFVAWTSPLQVAHSFLVLAILLFNLAIVTREKRDYARELAAFLPSY